MRRTILASIFLVSSLSACLAQSPLAQPARFLENKGQWNPEAKYLLHEGRLNLWIIDSGMVYDLFRTVGTRCARPSRNYSNTSMWKKDVRSTSLRMGQVVRVSFLHTAHAQANASNLEPGTSNYFIGNNPSKWVTGVRSFDRVRIRNLYSGVDAIFALDQGAPRYDLILPPGFDPSNIEMNVEGADSMTSDGNELVIQTRMGNIEERGLFAYQKINGTKQPVECKFRVAANHVSFDLGSFDRTKPLVIDPLIFSTYLGTNGDVATSIAVDRFGNSYITGWTGSQQFPVTAGAYQTTNNGTPGINAFITKLNANGSALIYSTYLGGSGGEFGDGTASIAIDSAGNAYVAGWTWSPDFPTTAGAFQPTSNSMNRFSYLNAFVTKLNPAGTALVYSTYLGGSNGTFDGSGENASGIAVDSAGDAFVVGTTSSSDFPVTRGAFQTKNGAFTYNIESEGDAVFVTKLNARGSGLIYSTYLGGSKLAFSGPYPSVVNFGSSIALNRAGDAFVTGTTNAADFPVTPGAFQTTKPLDSIAFNNAFVTELNPSGSGVIFSTYLGGSQNDAGIGIALDSAGEAAIMGTTSSIDFPITARAFQTAHHGTWDGFVAKLNANGSALVYSTFLDMTWPFDDYHTGVYDWYYGGNPIAVDHKGNAYVVGEVDSGGVPALPGAIQATNHGGADAVLVELTPDGSALQYSTYLGGTNDDRATTVALDSSGVYIAGSTGSKNFPVTPGAYDTHDSSGSFIAKISPLTMYLAADSSLRDFGAGSLCRSADTSIVFTNAGDDTLLLKSISLTGNDFSMLKGPSPGLMLPGASDTVSLAYDPTIGNDTAYLTIASNAANDSFMVIPLAAKTIATPVLHLRAMFSRTGVKANDTVTLFIVPDSTITTSGLSTIQMNVTYNGDLLTKTVVTSSCGPFQIVPQSLGSRMTLRIRFNVSTPTLSPSVPIASILFRTAVTDSGSTTITVSDPVFNSSDSNYARCALSGTGSSAIFSLTPDCNSPLIMAALNNNLVLAIRSIQPNPATTDVQIETSARSNASAIVEVFDEMGRLILTRAENVLRRIDIDTHAFPTGVYTVILESDGCVAQGQFVVE